MSTTKTEAPSMELELSELGNKISVGLEAFEAKKSELEALNEEVKGLNITSVEDKASLKIVSEGRKKLKAARVEIEKDAKAMRAGLNEKVKFISQKENELIAIIEPTEKELQKKEDWFKSETERIDREAKAAKEKKIQDRIDRLAEYGLEINLVHLEGLPDDEFEKVVESARKKYEIDQEELREQERIKEAERRELEELRRQKAESDRIIREQQEKIETDRLEKERLEKEYSDRIAREKFEKEAKEKADREAAERDLWRGRLSTLENVGWNGQEAFAKYHESVMVATYEMLISMTDEEFGQIRDLHNHKNYSVLEKRKADKELAEKQAEEKRIAQLEQAKKEAAEKAIADQKAKDEEDARQKAEALAQSSDKVKFEEVIKQLQSISIPDMKSAKHKKLSGEVSGLVIKIIDHIKAKS